MECLGDFEVIDSRKTVEQRDSPRHGIAIVERGGGDVIVGFGAIPRPKFSEVYVPPWIVGVKARRIASRRAMRASSLLARWISIFAEWVMAYSMQSRREREVDALWTAQRQKRRRIVYCFNILIDFVLQSTIQRACQNTKGIDYQQCDILALVRECKGTL